MCQPSTLRMVAAPFTSTATCSRTPPTICTKRVSADYTDMIYAETAKEIEERREAFLRKWRLKCRAVADSLEEAGDRLFTFTRLPPASGARRAPGEQRPEQHGGRLPSCASGSTGRQRRSRSSSSSACGGDGPKVLLAVKNMGGESEAAWRALF